MNYTQDEVNEIYGCDMSLFDIPVEEFIKIFNEELSPELAEELTNKILKEETTPKQDADEITPDIIEEAIEIFGNSEDTPDLIEEIKNHTCSSCDKKLSAYEINTTIYDEILCNECFDEWLYDNQDK